ncbi:hypothetical protein vseg_013100 [Gypsophila vaccaria]
MEEIHYDNTSSCKYKDPKLSIEERVEDLLSKMTLNEKLGQMTQILQSVSTPSSLIHLAIGSVYSEAGKAPVEKASVAEWADMVDDLQRRALESRLGIPLIYGIDAVHGHNSVYGATIFPHNVNVGATRDEEISRRIGAATALELRATGILFNLAPCVAVGRDPRWGRCYESYSEDPEVVRKMTSVISGLQGEPPKDHPKGYPFVNGRNNVVACAKHYVGDGGTENGVNEGHTMLSYEDLEKIHLAPYLDCVDQGVCTIMASYSSWNGSRLHGDHFLLTEVLKKKLGFKGFIISDWEGIDMLCEPWGSDYRFCISTAINAGIDMVMVPIIFEKFLEDLTFLVESGKIPLSRIDDAVVRILRVKFAAGLFEHPFSDRSLIGAVGCRLHRELAHEAVRKSLVLLKNGKGHNKPILPLNKNARKILVTGPHADNLGYQCGGWTATKRGLGGRITIGTTILEAIKGAVGENTKVIYEEYASSETLTRDDFTAAVVAVGERPYAECGGDDKVLTIPQNDTELINAVCDKVPTVVILISGRPLVVEPRLMSKMEALLAAFLPGTEGAGVSDVLFGDFDFQGVLPVTWFKNVEQLPMNFGDILYDPLFPFGHGLSTKHS